MIKRSLFVATLLLATSSFSEPISYTSQKDITIYKDPTNKSAQIKTIKAGEIISGTDQNVNGYIPIIGGYAKESDLIPVQSQEIPSKSGKSAKAIIENTLGTAKEIPVNYMATVKSDHVNFRSCPSVGCDVLATRNKGESVEIIAKTADAAWYKTIDDMYVSGKYIDIGYKTKQSVQKLIENKVENTDHKRDSQNIQRSVPKEEKIELSNVQPSIDIATSKNEQSDDVYAQSGEMAKKYPNEALIRNLTKTATPMPVKIPARYARALDFPILNKTGDVYVDYTYVWIKIKDEEFVLGKREGKSNSSQFTINKKVD